MVNNLSFNILYMYLDEQYCFLTLHGWWVVENLYLVCLHRYGLDLINGAVRDNKVAGVFEPAVSKLKSLKFATEAAITILRIDDMIKIQPAPKDQNTYGDAMARGDL